MKRLFALSAFIISSMSLSAQTGIFYQEVEWGMRHIAAAQSLDDLKTSFHIFQDLATRNQGSYLPDYYAALVLVLETDYLENAADRDSLVENAMQHIQASEALSPNNVELEFLRGYALTAKLMTDPEQRGQDYAPLITAHYEKAMSMDPQNPRAPTFLAKLMVAMPQFFTNAKYDPCTLAKSAKDLYHNYWKDHLLIWGTEVADELVQGCK